MPRQEREKSSMGMYHVMLRGINKQDIFFDEDDFARMMTILQEIPYKKDKISDKIISSGQCTIYSYCILHNHLHLLIKEGELSLSEIMKIIEDRYAIYYNRKYERVGHLFQGRFPSEAINDKEYFFTVLRYIAMNPVKAMESQTPEEYPYSSWNEYVCHSSNYIQVLKPSAIKAVLKIYSLQDLKDWVNKRNDDICLDMDSFYSIKSDKEAWDILAEISNIDNPEDFRSLDHQTQIHYLLEAIDHGVNIAQASRLGIVSRYQMTQAFARKRGESPTSGSDPDAEESVENQEVELDLLETIQEKVRHIPGMRKNTYLQFHKIVEFLHLHPSSKCQDVAEYINLSNERTRKHLVQLSNENIVSIFGKGKNTVYSVKNVENPSIGV